MKLKQTQAYKTLFNPFLTNNPISVQILGICSALAVTVQMQTALVMSAALTIVVAFSNLFVSLLRKITPGNIRIIVEISIIAALVILIDEFLKAYMYEISKRLSVFVGLIITNCIVLGRAETFARSNPPFISFVDGLGNGIGYSSVLIGVAFMRELLGSGTLMGYPVIPSFLYDVGYRDMGLMLLAPGAFILIGLFSWIQKLYIKKRNP
jgi:Na+-transporting NADH:ubiquinone oxidoreductase subunit D